MTLVSHTGVASVLAYSLELSNLGGTGNGAVQTYGITWACQLVRQAFARWLPAVRRAKETNQHTLHVNY